MGMIIRILHMLFFVCKLFCAQMFLLPALCAGSDDSYYIDEDGYWYIDEDGYWYPTDKMRGDWLVDTIMIGEGCLLLDDIVNVCKIVHSRYFHDMNIHIQIEPETEEAEESAGVTYHTYLAENFKLEVADEQCYSSRFPSLRIRYPDVINERFFDFCSMLRIILNYQYTINIHAYVMKKEGKMHVDYKMDNEIIEILYDNYMNDFYRSKYKYEKDRSHYVNRLGMKTVNKSLQVPKVIVMTDSDRLLIGWFLDQENENYFTYAFLSCSTPRSFFLKAWQKSSYTSSPLDDWDDIIFESVRKPWKIGG